MSVNDQLHVQHLDHHHPFRKRNLQHLFKRLGGPHSRFDRAGYRILNSPVYSLVPVTTTSSTLQFSILLSLIMKRAVVSKIITVIENSRPPLIVDCTGMFIDYSSFDVHSTNRKTDLHILHSFVDTVTGNHQNISCKDWNSSMMYLHSTQSMRCYVPNTGL